MGIMKDIFDTAKEIKAGGFTDKFMKTKQYSSIAKRSLEGTLQFQTLVTTSMDIDVHQMITKSLERQYASFMQVVLSMSPALHLGDDKDPVGYLRKFHQNSAVRTDFNDVLNTAKAMVQESSYAGLADDHGLYIMSAVYEGATNRIIADNKEQLIDLLEHVEMEVLNNKFIPRPATYNFSNPNLSATYNAVREAREPSNEPLRPDGKLVSDRLLRDNDVRKANELIPTTMHVRVMLINQENENQGYLDFIIGIKATMHPVSSDEVISNLLNGVRNKNSFFGFVRATTGETGFFKDFLFNIKGIKDDVVNQSAGASPWWVTLKRRGKLAKVKGSLTGKQLLPNTTIVISTEEAEHLRIQYNIDLMNVGVIDKVMKEYFLLGFVIVDNSAQVAHFLFDGHGSYQSITFGGMEKENNSKTDLRDMMKIINRTNMV